MKKRKQWLMLVCIALAVCLVSGGMLYIRQKNNNKMRCRTGSAGTGERTGCGGTE